MSTRINNELTYSTAENAIRDIVRFGDTVWLATAAMVPKRLAKALYDAAEQGLLEVKGLDDVVRVLSFHTNEPFHPVKGIQRDALFAGSNVRPYLKTGEVGFIPVHLGDFPNMIDNGTVHINAILISVSPPDEDGNCTIGTSAVCDIEWLKMAMKQRDAGEVDRIRVIAEVNPNVPKTIGDTTIHSRYIDVAARTETVIGHQKPSVPPSPFESAIGRHLITLLTKRFPSGGFALQTGIGGIIDALLPLLAQGSFDEVLFTTEMCSDGIIDLIENGVLRTPVETSFCDGSERLFKYVQKHPEYFRFYSTRRMNNRTKIASHTGLVAINGTMLIDLSGNSCADSQGQNIYSGPGGQMDYERAAWLSKNGLPVIAMPSKSSKGSKIVATLPLGSGIVTGRYDIHLVATERGIGDLGFKTLKERAMILIALSSPEYWIPLIDQMMEIHRFNQPVTPQDILKIWERDIVKDESVDFNLLAEM